MISQQLRHFWGNWRQLLVILLLVVGVAVQASPAHAQEDIVRAAVSDPAWQGAYWNNREMSGEPALVRSDPNLDFDWGGGSPDPAIRADQFSARWTRYLYLEAGLYRFAVTSDDGVRVFVNDRQIIDGWSDHPAQTFSADLPLATGHHLVRVEYYENADRALIRFNWERVSGGGETIQNWRGEYFNNRDLSGAPVFVRDDAEINFDWGTGSPAPSVVNSDNFSTRWTRTLNLPAGNYRFRLTVDDGARLWVNNALIIDQWREQGVTTYTSDIYLPGGNTPIRLEYFDYVGGAIVRLNWERTDGQPTPTNRWRGEYFRNRDLSGTPALVRDDDRIDFDWGNGSPAPDVLDNDNFSVRWTRTLDLPAGTYRFFVRMDDGARLWVNDRQLIDQWRIQPDTTYQGVIALAGGPTPVKLEYFEAGGAARASLWWEPLDQPAPTGRWRGEYFNNRDLSGATVLVRDDTEINFVWGNNSPAPGVVNSDNFSVRWTRTLDLGAGTYRFRVRVDDGARLWVNNRLLIDEWRNQPERTYTADIQLPGGAVPVRLEYFENRGGALVQLTWERVDTAENGQKWRGEYFNNRELSGSPALVRDDSAIDFTWGTGSPAPGVIASDNFSVRWTITLHFSGGRYRFTTESDDGVRLYIDDRLVIDQWREQDRSRYNAEVNLSRGNHRLRMEYFEKDGAAVARLGWRRIGNQQPAPVGNIITCVPPQPENYAWIKLYRLDSRGNWYATSRGIGTTNPDGYLKIDGLAVDTGRFGSSGEPYRVEQWVNGRVVRSTGNFQAGEPEFRVRPFTDNFTPWQCR
ncbi:MAG: hypothetical protein DCC55_02790 [Chloroflexi bacterium]|nr:MAG: hypothetical protein DCC55_02790 [Chloroflexota bacterium]